MTPTRGEGGGLQLFVLYDKVRISVENFLKELILRIVLRL